MLKENTDLLQEAVVRQKPIEQTLIINKRLKQKQSKQRPGDIQNKEGEFKKTGSSVVKPVINGLFGSRVPVINNNKIRLKITTGTEHVPIDVNATNVWSCFTTGGDLAMVLLVIEPLSIKKRYTVENNSQICTVMRILCSSSKGM
jgi:iron complex outermembrane receptor protein